MRVLIPGGAGNIGPHTCVDLLQAGHEEVVFGNICNARPVAMERITQITGKAPTFAQADVLDKGALDQVFAQQSIDAVGHFLGLKAVGEAGVKTLILISSSDTVHGDPTDAPVREAPPLFATNPYGHSKLIIEDILRDLYLSDPSWNLALLRYFNPVGTRERGLFSNAHPTPDSTVTRGCIHVVDLAKDHSAALKALKSWVPGENRQPITINLGSDQGHSVLDILHAFEEPIGSPYAGPSSPSRRRSKLQRLSKNHLGIAL